MNNRIGLIAITLTVATALFIGWLLLEPEQMVGEARAVPEGSATIKSMDLDVEDDAFTDDARPAEIEIIEPTENQESAPFQSNNARVYGRFVLPDGSPAEGVNLRMLGRIGNEERVREHGLPLFWSDPSTTSDEEGRFEFFFYPPQAFQFVIDARLDGYAEVSWRWGGILDGEEKDLGTIELARSGTILAMIKDSNGEVLGSGWTIYADSIDPGGDTGRDNSRVHAAIDPSTGLARLTDLPPGPAKLKADSRISGWIEGPTVDVIAGKEVEAEILYSGPDNSKRIVVYPWQVQLLSGLPTLEIDESSILISNDGISWQASKIQLHRSSSYPFDDLLPGLYTVKIDDERFDPWKKNNLVPGQRIKAYIHPNAALRVRVVDASNAEPVEDYSLQIYFGYERTGVNSTRHHNQISNILLPNEEGFITGIPPGIDSALIVKAKGYADIKIPLGVISPSETRAVEARMMRGTEVRGIVLLSDEKTPVAGAEVELRPVGEAFEYCLPGYWNIEDDGAPAFMAVTDKSGNFHITDVLPGTWSLHAYVNEWLLSSIEKLVVAKGVEKEGLQILLPPASFLQGRLIGKPGFSFKGMRLIVKLSAEPVIDGFFVDDEIEIELSADGTFHSEPLPPGKAILSLQRPVHFRSSGPGVALTEVDLPAGSEKKVEIELSESNPGSVRVYVTRDGTPLSGHFVVLAKCDSPNSWVETVTGTDGVAVVAPLFPGEWTVTVRRTRSGGWQYTDPDPVVVEAGKESERSVEVVVITGRIRILDAETGEPLNSRTVWLALPNGSMDTYETDADGWLDLTLAPGDYAMSTEYSRDREKMERLSWTFVGPTPDEIRLNVTKD